MAVFRKFKVEISNIVIGTPKRHFITRIDVFWRIWRKNPFKGVGCSLIEEPKELQDCEDLRFPGRTCNRLVDLEMSSPTNVHGGTWTVESESL